MQNKENTPKRQVKKKVTKQDYLFNVRISTKLYQDYKQFCEENSFTMSKRIRRMMEADMERWKLRKMGSLLN